MTQKKVNAKRLAPIILGIVVLVALVFSVREYLYFMHHEDTDDAQVDGDISPVIARAGGFLSEIRFKDNQQVKKGDTLFILDDKDYRIKLEQAMAAQESAQRNVNVAEAGVSSTAANLATIKANIVAAEARAWKAQQDYTRYKNLYNDHAITKAQLDAVSAEKDAADASLTAAKAQTNIVDKQIGTGREQVFASNSSIAQRKADVDFASLQLSYTVVVAPASGTVSKRSVQVGQMIQPGQSMVAVVQNQNLYITANFKETQMEHLKIGEPVDIKVDAFEKQPMKGEVESFSGATGAKFSLLPPDNASGNYVKVVQRVPVRIRITDDKGLLSKIRPGMSVKVSVHI